MTDQVGTLEGQVGTLESDSLALMTQVEDLIEMNGELMGAIIGL